MSNTQSKLLYEKETVNVSDKLKQNNETYIQTFLKKRRDDNTNLNEIKEDNQKSQNK